MLTTIDLNGQVVIPEEVRKQAGMTGRVEVDVREENGLIIIAPCQESAPIYRALGCWEELGKTTDEIMSELRERD